MEIRVLTAEDVRKALPMAEAIEAMKDAYRQLSSGSASVPLRSRIDVPEVGGVALFMPARLQTSHNMVCKIVSVFPQNALRNQATIHALVVALDSETGEPIAILEGASLTAIRTGAGSGAATEALARTDARVGAIFGSGAQARTQLEAVCAVRTLSHAYIFSLDVEGAQAMIADLAGRGAIPTDLRLAGSPKQAVEEADIICTATTSSSPVFDFADLKQGVHINAIGSFTPEMQEVDSQTIAHSLVVVDSRPAVLAESGDLIIPIQQGVITETHVHAEIGELLNGVRSGRTDATQITLFKSVGVAVQDAAAAARALAGAQERGVGRFVDL
jgi:ornithine cyclodeaminase